MSSEAFALKNIETNWPRGAHAHRKNKKMMDASLGGQLFLAKLCEYNGDMQPTMENCNETLKGEE